MQPCFIRNKQEHRKKPQSLGIEELINYFNK